MKNVLLVDDDYIFNFMNSQIIRKIDLTHEIRTAQNGKDAMTVLLDYYQKTSAFPDLILLDLNMPIMDGFGFLEAFDKISSPGKEHVNIVVVSSSDNPEDKEKAIRLGAEHYLTKPLSEERMRAVLQD